MSPVRGAPIRILIATKYFSENFGGTPESVLLLAQALGSLGISVDVVCPTATVINAHFLKSLPKLDISFAKKPNLNMQTYSGVFVAGPWNVQALKIGFFAGRAGVPVSYAPKGGLAYADFCRLRDVKKVFYFALAEVFLLICARTIIFSSAAERNNCAVPRFLWKNKQTILPEPFRPKPLGASINRVIKKQIVLGFLAEIRDLKGLRELVDAVSLLRASTSLETVKLRVAGVARPGSEKYLANIQKSAEDNGLSHYLEWMGGVRGDVARSTFYESLDIFVCPSKSESFGFTPLEALWHGIPVAMGPNIGARDFIPPSAPVLVFEEVTARNIASVLRKAITQIASLRAQASNWRERCLPGLADGDLAAKYFEVLTLHSRPRASRQP